MLEGLPKSASFRLLLLVLLAVGTASVALGDAIFLTGHDPDYHAALGPNQRGAQDIIKVGIDFVMDPRLNKFAAEGIDRFLFVEGNPPPPSDPTDYIDGTRGLAASGFTNYDTADYTTLASALNQLGTTYSALVIGSDFGGSLTQAELDLLDSHSKQIINFLNAGGGLFAMAESDSYVQGHESGGLTPDGGWYGYLPFVQPFGCGGPLEDNRLSTYGSSLGLTADDVVGNYAHNCFGGTYGLHVVDSTQFGAIQTLAGSGYVSPGGVAPEPCGLFLLSTGLAGIAAFARRHSKARSN